MIHRPVICRETIRCYRVGSESSKHYSFRSVSTGSMMMMMTIIHR